MFNYIIFTVSILEETCVSLHNVASTVTFVKAPFTTIFIVARLLYSLRMGVIAKQTVLVLESPELYNIKYRTLDLNMF